MSIKMWLIHLRSKLYNKMERFRPSCTLRPVAYLNNLLEQDHRFIKRRAKYRLGFGYFHTAWRTLRGFKMMHRIRKGQLWGTKRGDIVVQNLIIATVFGIAA
jgi:transposase, IS6 family